MENYQKIIDAFLAGNIEGIEEKGVFPEHIETQISHVFLFPKTVYKICKRSNQYFNENIRNLAELKSRIVFYKSDFIENKYFSPDVYLNLFGISIKDGNVVINNEVDTSEDVIMKMRRIDLKHNLTNLLHDKTLSEKDFKKMGYQQTKEVALFPNHPETAESYYAIFQRRLDDLRDWMYSAPDYFTKNETDKVIDIMRKYVEKEKKFFLNFDTSQYVISLDNHSDNIFYENEKVFFLDIYPPKEDWMIVTPLTNIYRPATDILILMGEKYARAFLQGYKDYYGTMDEKHELLYFIYSAAIQAVSLHNLSGNNQRKKEDSLLYKTYIMENIGNLTN